MRTTLSAPPCAKVDVAASATSATAAVRVIQRVKRIIERTPCETSSGERPVPPGWKNRRMGDRARKRSIADMNMTATALCFAAVAWRIGRIGRAGLPRRLVAEFLVEDRRDAPAEIGACRVLERAVRLAFDEHGRERAQAPDRIDERGHVGHRRQRAFVIAIEPLHDEIDEQPPDRVE